MNTLRRRTFVSAALGLGFGDRTAAAPVWQRRSLVGFGTTLHLQAGAADPRTVSTALDAAVRALREVEASMSLYRPDSEVCRLNREGRLDRPSPHFLAVLRGAQRMSRASHGAFDVTVQPLWALYDAAARAGTLPTAADVRAARSRVGWPALQVRDDAVRLLRPDMAITLNGIAQGYAADVARATLQAHGVVQALVDAGEFSASGHGPADAPWRIGLEDPRDAQRLLAAVPLDGGGLATSADSRSVFTPDRRHHHIFDPATGDSPPELASVSVLAGSAMLADALTKVMFVAGPARLAALARRWRADVWWVDKSGRQGRCGSG